MDHLKRSLNINLFVDLYELRMAKVYVEEGMEDDGVFSVSVRSLPKNWNFLVSCGLRTILELLENLSFDKDALDYLHALGEFSQGFLDWLRDFHWTGDVWALPEGTPFFPQEPILEIKAPLPAGQLVETLVLNQIHLQTLLATKASRVIIASQGKPVVDFGARRIHGIDAALKGARAFYIVGVSATSNVLAGKIYGIPIAGTMAHSFIQAFEEESEAFLSFMKHYPQTILLVDTYDTLEGVAKVIALAKKLGKAFQVQGIRLDSGDLFTLSKKVRMMLDEAGLSHLKIFASGGLDEYSISNLLRKGAPMDAFGVGTHMGVSMDAPALDIAYKLCEYRGKGRLKLSPHKTILPGKKQVYRQIADGVYHQDILAKAEEIFPGKPLLIKVMEKGKILSSAHASLVAIRQYHREAMEFLPETLKKITKASKPYPVTLSPSLVEAQEKSMKDLFRR